MSPAQRCAGWDLAPNGLPCSGEEHKVLEMEGITRITHGSPRPACPCFPWVG